MQRRNLIVSSTAFSLSVLTKCFELDHFSNRISQWLSFQFITYKSFAFLYCLFKMKTDNNHEITIIKTGASGGNVA